MKRGRPTNIEQSKNRVHSIVLSERAEFVFRRISERKGIKWIHDYLSDHLVRDFVMFKEPYLRQELLTAQQRMIQAETEVQKIAAEISALRREKEDFQEIIE